MPGPYGKKHTGEWIEDRGFVWRLLSDDEEGERHQRFVVELPGRQTILIAHNIDIAERIPLGMGDKVRFRGIYEVNDRGGVVHWTHRDPHGVEDGGFVEFRRKKYA